MVWIFILAGAFAQSAKQMGAIDATVNLTLHILPDNLLLAGIFLASCFISLSIGTSVGTIVALTPVAIGLAEKTGIDLAFMVAVVVGGSFFGDNLSFISDTTIASTKTQGCVMRDKFRVNSMIVVPAALVVLGIYIFQGLSVSAPPLVQEIEWVKVIPYLIVLGTAIAGMNVMLVLIIGIFTSGVIGIATGSLGFFDWFVKKEYKWSDKILTSSKSFDQSIRTYGDYKGKIVYYPQWSDGSPSTPFLPPNYSLPEILSGFKVMFAGAVGEAQGMECNMQATLLTKERKDIKWVIVGDGRRLPWVQQFVKEHGLEETVLTLGRYPSETMPLFFEKADVMLVSLTDSPLFNLYAPAKISSYMASGRPIIACLNGEGAEVVKAAECGWLVAAGDAEGLAKLVIRLADENKETLNAKGACGLKFYKENFDKEKCLSNLDDIVFSK